MSFHIEKKSDAPFDPGAAQKKHAAGEKTGAGKSGQFSSERDTSPASVETTKSCHRSFFTQPEDRISAGRHEDYRRPVRPGRRPFSAESETKSNLAESASVLFSQNHFRRPGYASQNASPCNLKIISQFNNKENPKKIGDVIRVTMANIERCDNMSDALRLMENLSKISSEAGKVSQLDARLFNAYITKANDCCRTQSLRSELDNTLSMMREHNVAPDACTFICMLTAYKIIKDINSAELMVFDCNGRPSLLRQWRLTEEDAGIPVYSALLGVCAAAKNKEVTERVLALFIENTAANKTTGVRRHPLPNEIACVCLLTAFESYQDIGSAVRLVFGDNERPSLLARFGLTATTKIYSALLGVCAAAKNRKVTERVLALFIENAAANKRAGTQLAPVPNERASVCLLTAFASYQDITSAVRLVLGGNGESSLLRQWQLTANIRIYNALLGVCAAARNKGVTERVLELFITNVADNKKKGAQRHPLPNEITCVGLLTAFASYQDINSAVCLVLFCYGGRLSLIRQWGVTATVKIYNALLGVCAATRNKDVTERVLELFIRNVSDNKKDGSRRHPMPDEITCVCLLTAFESYQDIGSASRLVFSGNERLSLLRQWGLTATVKIYNALLGVCAAAKNKDVTERVLALFIKNVADNKKEAARRRPVPDEIACVCLLTAFASYQDIGSASRLVFSDNGRLSLLRQWGVTATVKIYNALLGVCAATRSKEVTERVLALFIKNSAGNKKERAQRHPLPDEIACICLLTAFESYQDIVSAVRLVFGDNEQPSLLAQFGLTATTKIYSALLGVCAAARNKDVTERVLALFITNAAENKKEGNRCHPLPDEKTGTRLLTAFASYQDIDSAARLVFGDDGRPSLLEQWGVTADITIYNALLGVCAATRSKEVTERVLALFIKNSADNKKERAQRHPLPNEIVCVCLLTAFESYQDIDSAVRLVFGDNGRQSLLEQWGLTATIKIYCALLGLCAATKNKDVTERVLALLSKNVAANNSEKAQRYPLPDEIVCVCLLTAFESYQDIDSAVRLVFGDNGRQSLLEQWGLTATIKIYCALLGLCAATKNKDVTERVLALLTKNAAANNREKAQRYPVPDERTCTCLLTAFASYQDIDSAVRLVFGDDGRPSLLEQWGLTADNEIYSALLGICAAAGNKKVTERVLALFIRNAAADNEAQAQALPVPDEIACIRLLMAFASYQDTESAQRLVFGDGQRQSYLSRWRLTPGSDIYAYWALVDSDNFAQRIEELTDRNICHQSLGLIHNTLNFHSNCIFNNGFEDTPKGVPFEFAKALYEYHLNRNQSGNSINIITGYNSGDKLKSQFISYFREKGVNVRSNPANPGMILTGT